MQYDNVSTDTIGIGALATARLTATVTANARSHDFNGSTDTRDIRYNMACLPGGMMSMGALIQDTLATARRDCPEPSVQ